jgi:PAS domain S-box-containing protein
MSSELDVKKAFDVLYTTGIENSLAGKLKKELAPIAEFTADCLCFFEEKFEGALCVELHFSNDIFLGHSASGVNADGRWLFSQIATSDLPAFNKIIRKALYGSTSFSEIKVKDVNGAFRLCHLIAKPIWDEKATLVVAGVIALSEIAVDDASQVTNSKRSHTVIDLVLSNFVLTEADGSIISYSGDARKLLRLPVGENPVRKHLQGYLALPYRELPITGCSDYGEFEVELNSEDGQAAWLLLCSFPIEKSGSSRGSNIIILRDITSAKLAQKALVDSEQKFRALSENCPGVIFLEVDQKIVYVSPQIKNAFGYSVYELLEPGFDFRKLLPGLNEKEPLSYFLEKTYDNSACAKSLEVFVKNKNGSTKVCCLALQHMPYQGRKAYLGIFTDLTDLRRVNEKLTETWQRYWVLFEASSDSIFIETFDGVILDCNQAAEKCYGYSKGELLGMNAKELVPGEYVTSLRVVAEELAKRESAGKTLQVISTGQRRDGTIFPTEVLINDLELNSERLYLVTVRDISLRKELEEARTRYDNQMQQIQLLDSFTNVVSGLANDFNNILTGIMGYSDLIMRDTSPASPVRDKAKKIFEASRRGADIINQLIAATGKLPANFKKADLKSLVRDIIPFLTEMVRARGPLTCLIDENIEEIFFDANQIKLAIENLVKNAFEATEGQGKFSLNVEVGQNSFSGNETGYFGPPMKSGSYVEIKVTDQGCGIPQSNFSRIFEPFFSTGFAHRGLGLAIVLGIVRSHHGAMYLVSKLNEGSSFSLLLPGKAGEQKMRANDDNSTHAQLPKFPAGAILVIDDEESVNELICGHLNMLGYQTFAAFDGKQAVEMFKSLNRKLSVVFLDLNLPCKSGYAILEDLRWLNPKIPVIVCTGMSVAQDRLKNLDVSAVLNKPFKMVDIEKVLLQAQMAE